MSPEGKWVKIPAEDVKRAANVILDALTAANVRKEVGYCAMQVMLDQAEARGECYIRNDPNAAGMKQ